MMAYGDKNLMDLNLHRMPRSLISRAKSHAAALGLTLKDWVIGLIERALSAATTDVCPTVAKPVSAVKPGCQTPRNGEKVDANDTVPTEPTGVPKPPMGRRDL